MVLMNATKSARNVASLTNNTNIFGVMGGLAPQNGINYNMLSPAKRRQRNQQTLSPDPELGKVQMIERNILSRNPQGSGGVGKIQVIAHKKTGPCRGTCKPLGIPRLDDFFASSDESGDETDDDTGGGGSGDGGGGDGGESTCPGGDCGADVGSYPVDLKPINPYANITLSWELSSTITLTSIITENLDILYVNSSASGVISPSSGASSLDVISSSAIAFTKSCVTNYFDNTSQISSDTGLGANLLTARMWLALVTQQSPHSNLLANPDDSSPQFDSTLKELTVFGMMSGCLTYLQSISDTSSKETAFNNLPVLFQKLSNADLSNTTWKANSTGVISEAVKYNGGNLNLNGLKSLGSEQIDRINDWDWSFMSNDFKEWNWNDSWVRNNGVAVTSSFYDEDIPEILFSSNYEDLVIFSSFDAADEEEIIFSSSGGEIIKEGTCVQNKYSDAINASSNSKMLKDVLKLIDCIRKDTDANEESQVSTDNPGGVVDAQPRNLNTRTSESTIPAKDTENWFSLYSSILNLTYVQLLASSSPNSSSYTDSERYTVCSNLNETFSNSPIQYDGVLMLGLDLVGDEIDASNNSSGSNKAFTDKVLVQSDSQSKANMQVDSEQMIGLQLINELHEVDVSAIITPLKMLYDGSSKSFQMSDKEKSRFHKLTPAATVHIVITAPKGTTSDDLRTSLSAVLGNMKITIQTVTETESSATFFASMSYSQVTVLLGITNTAQYKPISYRHYKRGDKHLYRRKHHTQVRDKLALANAKDRIKTFTSKLVSDEDKESAVGLDSNGNPDISGIRYRGPVNTEFRIHQGMQAVTHVVSNGVICGSKTTISVNQENRFIDIDQQYDKLFIHAAYKSAKYSTALEKAKPITIDSIVEVPGIVVHCPKTEGAYSTMFRVTLTASDLVHLYGMLQQTQQISETDFSTPICTIYGNESDEHSYMELGEFSFDTSNASSLSFHSPDSNALGVIDLTGDITKYVDRVNINNLEVSGPERYQHTGGGIPQMNYFPFFSSPCLDVTSSTRLTTRENLVWANEAKGLTPTWYSFLNHLEIDESEAVSVWNGGYAETTSSPSPTKLTYKDPYGQYEPPTSYTPDYCCSYTIASQSNKKWASLDIHYSLDDSGLLYSVSQVSDINKRTVHLIVKDNKLVEAVTFKTVEQFSSDSVHIIESESKLVFMSEEDQSVVAITHTFTQESTHVTLVYGDGAGSIEKVSLEESSTTIFTKSTETSDQIGGSSSKELVITSYTYLQGQTEFGMIENDSYSTKNEVQDFSLRSSKYDSTAACFIKRNLKPRPESDTWKPYGLPYSDSDMTSATELTMFICFKSLLSPIGREILLAEDLSSLKISDSSYM